MYTSLPFLWFPILVSRPNPLSRNLRVCLHFFLSLIPPLSPSIQVPSSLSSSCFPHQTPRHLFSTLVWFPDHHGCLGSGSALIDLLWWFQRSFWSTNRITFLSVPSKQDTERLSHLPTFLKVRVRAWLPSPGSLVEKPSLLIPNQFSAMPPWEWKGNFTRVLLTACFLCQGLCQSFSSDAFLVPDSGSSSVRIR